MNITKPRGSSTNSATFSTRPISADALCGAVISSHQSNPLECGRHPVHQLDRSGNLLRHVISIQFWPEALQKCDVQLGVVFDLIDQPPVLSDRLAAPEQLTLHAIPHPFYRQVLELLPDLIFYASPKHNWMPFELGFY